MCGITGWSLVPGADLSRETLVAMTECLRHRGPDDEGFLHDPARGVALGHRRLSIIDLSVRAHQPMYSESEGIALAYNGEIYNFRSLRQQLEAAGHAFHSDSDTEVVLRAYEEWGDDCVRRFAGMFALAIWSAETNSILLARDPLGIKPLFYTALPNGKGVAFSSELKAFLQIPGFSARLDRAALEQYVELGYTYENERTSLEGVHKLSPGTTLRIGMGSVSEPTSFFRAEDVQQDLSRSYAEREVALHELMSEVVAEHMIADVPVGILLSGGLDSSLIASLATRSGKVTTLTMAFGDSTVDERPFARQVSRFIGSEHLEAVIRPEDVYESIDEAIWYFDDLFSDWGMVSTRLLYQKARALGLKVVLVGEGSDELFGGYDRFEEPAGKFFEHQLFSLYRSYAGRRYGRGYLRFRALMSKYRRNSNDWFSAIRLFEVIHQLPNQYIMKVDRASMSASVEARTPFLDVRVATLALSTPASSLLSGRTNKMLLRTTAARFGLLPPEIADRPKFGASIASSWMDESTSFRAYARKMILDEPGWTDELGMRRAMTLFFDRSQQGYPFPHPLSLFSNAAWRLLLLNLWSAKYLGATR